MTGHSACTVLADSDRNSRARWAESSPSVRHTWRNGKTCLILYAEKPATRLKREDERKRERRRLGNSGGRELLD
jgi:hypothetical protein